MYKRLKEMIENHTVGMLSGLFIFGIVLVLWYFSNLQASLVDTIALQDAKLYSESIQEFRTLYTSEVVSKVLKSDGEISVTHDYASKHNAIPLPATLSMLLGERIGMQGSGAQTRLYSNYPFPWRKETGGLKDNFSKEAWTFLNANKTSEFYRIEEVNNRISLRYARADLMRPSCVNCHNTHPESPKTDWAKNDVRGVLEVILPMDSIKEQAQKGIAETFGVLLVLGGVILFGIAIVLRKLRTNADEARAYAKHTKKMNVQLEQEITDRVKAEIQRETIMKELVAINQELESIVYVTSHDLRSPLVNLQGFSKELEFSLEDINSLLSTEADFNQFKQRLADILGDEIPMSLNFIRSSANKMNQLLNGLLKISRLGQHQFDFETIDMNQMINEIVNGMQFQIREKNIEVIAYTLPSCTGDGDKINQVFTNLIDNAVKYMPNKKHAVIRVGATENNQTITYFVEDNGSGIKENHLDNIFKIFHRLDPNDNIGGEGLGLTIVRRIIDRHSGHVTVKSTMGQGTTFFVTLPKEQLNKQIVIDLKHQAGE